MGLAGPWGGERVRQAHVCTNLSEAWKFLDNCMYLQHVLHYYRYLWFSMYVSPPLGKHLNAGWPAVGHVCRWMAGRWMSRSEVAIKLD